MALREERRLEIQYLYGQGVSIEEVAKSLKMWEGTMAAHITWNAVAWVWKGAET